MLTQDHLSRLQAAAERGEGASSSDLARLLWELRDLSEYAGALARENERLTAACARERRKERRLRDRIGVLAADLQAAREALEASCESEVALRARVAELEGRAVADLREARRAEVRGRMGDERCTG